MTRNEKRPEKRVTLGGSRIFGRKCRASLIGQLPDRIKVAEDPIGVTGFQPRFNPACLHGFFVLSCRFRSSSKGVGCVSRPSSRKSNAQSVTAGCPAAVSSGLADSAGASNADMGFNGDGTGNSASSRQNVRRIWRCGMPASSKGSPSVTKPSFS